MIFELHFSIKRPKKGEFEIDVTQNHNQNEFKIAIRKYFY